MFALALPFIRTTTPPADVRAIAATIARLALAYPRLGVAARLAHLTRLTEAGAATEAALRLVELQLPDWRVQRLIHDEDEWLCTLSQHPQMPLEFDDAVDGRASALPIAILNAIAEAHRRIAGGVIAPSATTPADPVWCDNAS